MAEPLTLQLRKALKAAAKTSVDVSGRGASHREGLSASPDLSVVTPLPHREAEPESAEQQLGGFGVEPISSTILLEAAPSVEPIVIPDSPPAGGGEAVPEAAVPPLGSSLAREQEAEGKEPEATRVKSGVLPLPEMEADPAAPNVVSASSSATNLRRWS